jgi:hypothetical protein
VGIGMPQRLGVIWPAGLLVVLDASALCGAEADQLRGVLREVARLRQQEPVPNCVWGVAAAADDVEALRRAADAGQQPAAESLAAWEGDPDGVARRLRPEELSPAAGSAGECGAAGIIA